MNQSNGNTRKLPNSDHRVGLFRGLKFKAGKVLYHSMRLLGRLMPDRSKPGSILLINLNGIGDVIVSTSALSGIRMRFPERRICFVTHEAAGSVLEGNPNVDEIYIHSNKNRLKSLIRYLSFCRRFRPEYTLALNPGYKNTLLACISSSTKKIWFLREDRIVTRSGRNTSIETIRADNIAAYAHIATARIGCNGAGSPQLFISEANRVPILQNGIRPVVLFVGGKWYWKRWDPEKFAHLADRLCKDYRVVVCGGRGDEPIVDEVRARSSARESVRYRNAENIRQLASIIGQAEVLVTTDTVAVHVATAVGTRAVILFGPTVPEKVLSRNSIHLPLSKGLPCQPCYSVATGKGNCIQNTPSLCLKSFTAEEVADKVHSLITHA